VKFSREVAYISISVCGAAVLLFLCHYIYKSVRRKMKNNALDKLLLPLEQARTRITVVRRVNSQGESWISNESWRSSNDSSECDTSSSSSGSGSGERPTVDSDRSMTISERDRERRHSPSSKRMSVRNRLRLAEMASGAWIGGAANEEEDIFVTSKIKNIRNGATSRMISRDSDFDSPLSAYMYCPESDNEEEERGGRSDSSDDGAVSPQTLSTEEEVSEEEESVILSPMGSDLSIISSRTRSESDSGSDSSLSLDRFHHYGKSSSSSPLNCRLPSVVDHQISIDVSGSRGDSSSGRSGSRSGTVNAFSQNSDNLSREMR